MKLYILLTRMPDWGSRMLSVCSHSFYTHASVGLGEDLSTFYSMCLHGFRVEDIHRYNRSPKGPFPCALYELNVSEETYHKVKNTLNRISAGDQKPKYTRFGVFLGLLGIAHRFRGYRYCSQFVSEILEKCHAARLEKDSSLYLPQDLAHLRGMRLVFRGKLTYLPI